MSKVIDGKKIANDIKDEIKEKVSKIEEESRPCLAVIIVGEDPASKIYVKHKKKACEYVGFKSLEYVLDKDTTQDELLHLVYSLNQNDNVHGILCQLPLPEHIDEDAIIKEIDSKKDVDCFHPYNVGLLSIGKPRFLPCTPAGIIELLKRSNVEIQGSNSVILGRSNIVGKPIAYMLLKENSTITICHSKTKNLKEKCQEADILIAAIGKAEMIDSSYLKEDVVVIDVGMNRNSENKLCGDVFYDDVYDKVNKITPVPGGVGPMTIAMLMKNTLKAYEIAKAND